MLTVVSVVLLFFFPFSPDTSVAFPCESASMFWRYSRPVFSDHPSNYSNGPFDVCISVACHASLSPCKLWNLLTAVSHVLLMCCIPLHSERRWSILGKS